MVVFIFSLLFVFADSEMSGSEEDLEGLSPTDLPPLKYVLLPSGKYKKKRFITRDPNQKQNGKSEKYLQYPKIQQQQQQQQHLDSSIHRHSTSPVDSHDIRGLRSGLLIESTLLPDVTRFSRGDAAAAASASFGRNHGIESSYQTQVM